jgi:hypothetical protein
LKSPLHLNLRKNQISAPSYPSNTILTINTGGGGVDPKKDNVKYGNLGGIGFFAQFFNEKYLESEIQNLF